MFRKTVICALMVLLLATAAVTAAGQGSGAGTAGNAGSGLQVQQHGSADTAGQGQSQNGNAQMLQVRKGDGTGNQTRAVVRNMTRNQTRLHTDAVGQQTGASEMFQKKLGASQGRGQMVQADFAEQVKTQFRNAGGIFRSLVPQS